MDIQTFIKETLCQIVSGVEDARKCLAASETKVLLASPVLVDSQGNVRWGLRQGGQQAQVYSIGFDLAVSVTESGKGDSDLGISIMGLKAGTKAETSVENASVSRVRFEVPLVWHPGREPSSE